MKIFKIILYSLTFRGQCIAIYCCNKSQREGLSLNFILVKKSTCFGQIYCPSSGVTAIGICYTSDVDSLLVWSATSLADSQHN